MRPRLACLVLLFASRAVAEPTDPASADALFRAGREASDRGDTRSACSHFAESYRLEPAVGTLLNLALCKEALGELATAWEHYQRLLDQLGAQDERLRVVRERLGALEPRVPRLTLSVAEGTPEIMAQRDGIRLTRASFDVPLPLNPGHHVIVVQAAGREPRRYELDFEEGTRSSLVLEAGEPIPSKPAARRDRPRGAPARPASGPGDTDGLRVAGAAFVGAGAVSLLAAGGIGVALVRQRDVIDTHCNGDKECDATGLRAVGATEALQVAMWGAGILGVACGAAGVVMLTWGPSSGSRSTDEVALGWSGRF